MLGDGDMGSEQTDFIDLTGPDLPCTSTEHRHSNKRRAPLLEMPKDLDLEAWNKEQAAERIWADLIQIHSGPPGSKKLRLGPEDIRELAMFLRDQFPKVRMPVIYKMISTKGFYESLLILHLVTIGWQRRLTDPQHTFISPTLIPLRLPPGQQRPRPEETLEPSELLPKYYLNIWRRFERLLRFDYTQELLNMTSFECPICFDVIGNSDAVLCTALDEDIDGEPHKSCVTCVRQHAVTTTTEMAIGPGGAGVRCPGFNCKAIILSAHVLPLLNAEETILFTKRQDSEAIRSAQIANVENCQRCEFAAEMLIGKGRQPIFECRNSACGHKHCRMCGKPYDKLHEGRKCDEMLTPKELERLKKEEELTALMVRKCPKCDLAFQKMDGCNKMTCYRCRTTMCYVCRQVNINYDHFGLPPLCQLHQHTENEDEQRRIEAIDRDRGNEAINDEDLERLY
ncbi:unnamed protein product, partial [Mesorhabditis spiculigera]